MGSLPGSLDAKVDRDLESRERHQMQRRLALGALGLLVLAAALNLFGQRTVSSASEGSDAKLTVEAPSRLRGGVIFEGRFVVEANAALDNPTLVLQPGWLDTITLNSLEPTPKDEGSRPDGALELLFPPIPAGGSLTFVTQWQVNPTAVGRKQSDVILLDGEREIARVDRTATIFP